jgi:brefeldin A-inhibited guanine nucleotide-exchange protein
MTSPSIFSKPSLGSWPNGMITSTGLTYRNPIDEMIGKLLKNCVDDVCLYHAKIDFIEKENENKNRIVTEINEEKYNKDWISLKFIPLNPIPRTPEDMTLYCNTSGSTDTDSQNSNSSYSLNYASNFFSKNFPYSTYAKLSNPCVENERGFISGNFGWCFICRNKADFYCKESRYPICSLECKLKLYEEDEKIIKYQNGELISEDDVALLYFYDAVSIFKSLCKLVSTAVSSKNEAFNSRAKVISLELILSILEKPGSTFLTQKEFIKIVKDDLMEGLLRNCVSDDVNLFSLSLSVFFKVWHQFREHLKAQISVFIETVFLKIIDSGNSSFNHKWCVMDNFYKLAGTPKFFVELYVNYDCDIDEKDLLNRIVFALSKISQGKYTKNEHSGMITPQQEYLLRTRALDILTMITRTLLMFTQDQVGWNNREDPRQDIIDGHSTGNNTQTNANLTINPDLEMTEDGVSMLDVTQSDSTLKEKLDLNRKMKSDITTAVEKFNIKVKSGILYLKKIGLVSKDNKDQEAKDIAYFLKNSHGLKKEHIGEWLGENNEVALKTMHYYINSYDFCKMHIVDAIRTFLSNFQLPGEGQKIDRIMEKFAAKYYNDNPGIYETADCAYYVAFSVIMLQTSIHNPNVKKKMTLEEFGKMLKGMNGGKDLDPAYIADIYSQIQTKSITLVEHEEAKDKLEGTKDLKKKQDLFKKETERMYQEGTERLKKGKDKQYLKVCEIEHIAPMMDSIWTALLAMYSLILEDSDDETLDSLSVEGISNCIKLCGMLNLDLQKEALIKGFCKLTNLLQGKEIKEKHILCIRAILQLANIDGRFLRGCWKNVLELISKIDYYHMVISGSRSELETFFTEIKNKKRGSINVDRELLVERNNMEKIAKEISPDDYEIIFNKTILLDQDSIIDFVKSLCEISREELAGKDSSSARIFSLQKLVEVAEFNMNRVRIVWANLWNIISEHLTEVGSNSSPVIAEKAVDSLRQLAKKFLQKDEISVYQFQKEFLKPFENILVNNINVYRTKEYVITCITNLVLAEAPSIKSGWRIIFNIFQLAAEDSSKDIIRKTFDTIVKVFNNHFTQVRDNFPELAHCLKKFSISYPEEVINLFFNSYKLLDDSNHIFALLSSLASILNDSRENIRKLACDKLFDLLDIIVNNNNIGPSHHSQNNFASSASGGFNNEGNFSNSSNNNFSHTVGHNSLPFATNPSTKFKITADFWKQTFKIIIKPIIDDLISNKYSSTLENVLFEVCDLFEKYYHKVEFLLSDFLQELSNISSSDNEAISLSGIEALKYLINKDNELIPKSNEFWEGICFTLADIFNKTRQQELLDLDIKNFNDPVYQSKYQDIVYKNIVFCIVQHNLIELCEFVIDNYNSCIRINDLNLLLDCLRDSFELAYKFNIEFNLRKLISYHFMSDLSQIAALFKQQQDGTALYYKILNKIFDLDFYDENIKNSCKKKLLIISHSILKQFVDRINFQVNEEVSQTQQGQYLIVENERLMKNMVPAIIDHIIPSLIKIDFDNELEYLDDFTKIFINIIPCNIYEVRLKIKEVLSLIFDKMKGNLNTTTSSGNKVILNEK